MHYCFKELILLLQDRVVLWPGLWVTSSGST